MGFIIVVGILVIVMVRSSAQEARLTASPAGQAFTSDQDNNYTDITGNSISLRAMAGQTFVVTTWASWCPHCLENLEAINAVMADYPTLRTLAINRKESKAQVNRYLVGVQTFENLELLIDTSDQFFTTVAGYTMPETLIFDENGAVVHHVRGNINPTTFRNQLDEAIRTN